MSKYQAKMLTICTLLFLLIILQSLHCQRRIKSGKDVNVDHSYVVYFTKASKSPRHYDNWICGGAIVNPDHILTSAACVDDIGQMYAIAGYKKYVPTKDLEEDKCTKSLKKKVILTCVPKAYEFGYDKVEQWSLIDIAVAKVESPFDFNDERYTTECSYKPSTIKINYNAKYQSAGYDAIVLGWGHQEVWRQPSDTTDYNEKTLKYAPVLIQGKDGCKEAYKHFDKMDQVIDSYMICTHAEGNLNDDGEQMDMSKPMANGCVTTAMKLMGVTGKPCDDGPEDEVHVSNESYKDIVVLDETRRNGSESRFSNRTSRRNGICQNDHGGPLVSWIGKHQYVIGVASVFMVDTDNKCAGPYLFTSTQCNGRFLYCILDEEVHKNLSLRSFCSQPPILRGFDTIVRKISWFDHPDGPADNEVIKMRPQIPLNMYGD